LGVGILIKEVKMNTNVESLIQRYPPGIPGEMTAGEVAELF
jgi:hypothetical protein